MHAIRIRCQGYVQAVIDQNLGALWTRKSNGLTRKFCQGSCTQIFFPNLNQLDTVLCGQANGIKLRTAGFFFAVRVWAEYLAIGDQIE